MQPRPVADDWPDPPVIAGDLLALATCRPQAAAVSRAGAPRPVLGIAPGHRLVGAPLLAFIVVVEERPAAQVILLQLSPSALKPCSQTSGQTRDVFSLIASSASTLATLTSSLVPAWRLNSVIERCDAAFQSPSAAAVRQPTRRSSACTDLVRSARRPGCQAQRREVRRLSAAGACRRGSFGGARLLLRRGGLVLRHLLGFFGSDTRLLGRLGVGLGLGLLGLLRALGGKPRPLLFGQPRLFGGGDPRFFGGDLVELKLGQAGVETVRILREERVQGALVADLQRQFVIAASFGLRTERGRGRRRVAPACAGTSGTSSPPSEP